MRIREIDAPPVSKVSKVSRHLQDYEVSHRCSEYILTQMQTSQTLEASCYILRYNGWDYFQQRIALKTARKAITFNQKILPAPCTPTSPNIMDNSSL